MCSKTILTLSTVLCILELSACTPTVEPTSSSEFENYAILQLNFILDHILHTSKTFVHRVVAHDANNSLQDRSALKRFLEEVNQVLNGGSDMPISYELVSRKLEFLKGRHMRELQTHLSEEHLREYKMHKASITAWLDKTAESMRSQYNRYTADDPLRYQHFNNMLDDVPTASDALQKLNILNEITEIVVNKTPIRFTDLYMQ